MRPARTRAFLALGFLLVAASAYGEESAPAAAPDVKALAAELGAPDVERRRKAAFALWNAGAAAQPAIPALARALRDDDEYVRTTADKVLATFRMGKAFGALEVAVPELAEALGDERVEVRRLAAGALWRMGGLSAPPPHASLSPALVRALDDPDRDVRAMAAATVATMAVWVPDTVAALRRRVVDADKEVRVWALQALAAGPGLADSVELVVAAMADGEPTVRAAAAAALGFPGAKAVVGVPHLVAALSDPDVRVRDAAVGAFVGISGAVPSPEAVPKLLALLKAPESRVRGSAAAALGAIGDARAIDAVAQRASDDVDASVRAAAAGALGTMGPEAAEALPVLIGALEDADAFVATTAAAAIRDLRSFAAEAEPALRRMLRRGDPGARSAAISALSMLGPLAEETRAEMIAALEDPEPRVRHAAMSWRAQSGDSSPAWVSVLIRHLEGDPASRSASLAALARMGPPAAEAAAAIRAVTGDDLLMLGRAYALARIGAREQDVTEGVRALAAWLGGGASAEGQAYFAVDFAIARLADLGPVAAAARGALCERFVFAKDVAGWVAPAEALIAIDGAAAHAAVERLRSSAREGNAIALMALLRRLPSDPETEPLVLAALRAGSGWVRTSVIESLGALREAPAIRKALEETRSDTSGRVRVAAAHALRERK